VHGFATKFYTKVLLVRMQYTWKGEINQGRTLRVDCFWIKQLSRVGLMWQWQPLSRGWKPAIQPEAKC